jgi:DNA polymerase-3 subunit alpha
VLNKRALEALIKCGAFDHLPEPQPRKGSLELLDVITAWAQRHASDRLLGQSSLFDLGGDDAGAAAATHHPVIAPGEYDKAELLRLEKESLGLYVSEHPLAGVRDQLRRKTDATLAELERRRDGEVVTVGGIVSDIKQVTTKRGEPMVFLALDDPTGTAEVVVFNSTYAAARDLCVPDRILVVKGRVDHKQQGETKLIASEVTPFEAVRERREVRFRIDARRAPAGVIAELARLVGDFPGESPVFVSIETSEGSRTLALGPQYRVQPDPDFFAEAKALFGEAAIA